jgi:hypothetical protein
LAPKQNCHPEQLTCLRQVQRTMNKSLHAPAGHNHNLVIPTGANPDFLLRYLVRHPRVRFSLKENRLKRIDSTDLDRKSGKRSGEPGLSEVEWRPAVLFARQRLFIRIVCVWQKRRQ